MINRKSGKLLLNTHRGLFEGVGQYDIPEILPINEVDVTDLSAVCVNYMNTRKVEPEKSLLHFFIDDYSFERLWNNPDKYLPILKKYKYVIAPDFSLYTDHPKAVQIFNHYRKHWLARYYQENGVNIIPCICWSDEESFDFCFDGEPTNSIVATSTIGPWKRLETRTLWQRGFDEMINRLNPTEIIMLGQAHSLAEKYNIPMYFFDNDNMTGKVKARLAKKQNL